LSVEVVDLDEGGIAHFRITGAPPGATVGVAYGRALGDGSCPDILGGACFDLTRPLLLGTGMVTGPDAVDLPLALPSAASPGMLAYFQAFAVGIGTSDPVLAEVGPPRPSPDPRDAVPGLWTMVAGAPPVTLVPADTAFYTFYEDGSLSLAPCGPPMGSWSLDPAGSTILVDLGFPLRWEIVALDDDELVFSEASDTFYLQRRPSCE
ncbi:MAG: hypothetical protein ACI8PZ_000754, partial [Myxococcota bacterium]